MEKIRTKDTVYITTGKDRGKRGPVLSVNRGSSTVVVEGLNLRVKNVRPKRANEKGQRVQFAAPLALSNVLLVCPRCSKPTRAGRIRVDGKAMRRCSQCDQTFA
jgi:large subunit ribosomal protein L24